MRYFILGALFTVLIAAITYLTRPADAASFRPCARANIIGTPFNDFLVGTALRDVIRARGGNDRILGLGGADIICGNAGNDAVDGGEGSDFGYGGDGNNRCSSIEIESGC